jgi:transcription initiation factor TFIID subunit 8
VAVLTTAIMYQPQQGEPAPPLYNPYTGHYPTQAYNATAGPSIQPILSFFPSFPHTQQAKASPAPDLPPPPPDFTSITPDVASQAIQRLISAELRDVGFDSAQAPAVKRIELEVIACVYGLFTPSVTQPTLLLDS